VRTAVVSDLHLGSRTRVDLLRQPGPLAALAAALQGADQLVLLGDTIELRDYPIGQAVRAALPFLETIRHAMSGGRVVIVPGNHDHRLAWDAFELRRPERRLALSVVQEAPPGRSGPLAAVRDVLATEVLVAYPGFWIGDRVWATHGHYLDVHSAAPTLETAASALLAAARPRRGDGAGPAAYEEVLWPTYELFYAIAQRGRMRRAADAGKQMVRAVEAALGTRGLPVPSRAGSTPLSLRLGGTRSGLAPGEVRRPGALPFRQVVEILGVQAERVLFGHTHRTAPVAGDDPHVWCMSAGTTLHNTGSWVDETAYHGGRADSPYWPGTVTIVEGTGAPQAVRALRPKG
jgi:predicted phosphodiesterase